MTAQLALHLIAAFIVLAEALNKTERANPLRPDIALRTRLVDGLKAAAWLLLALGAGGELANPVIAAMGINRGLLEGLTGSGHPTVTSTLVLLGFAVLIVRTRVKEG